MMVSCSNLVFLSVDVAPSGSFRERREEQLSFTALVR